MTHAKKAAELIHPEYSKDWYETQVVPNPQLLGVSKEYFEAIYFLAEEKRAKYADIIQTHAINPAVDESTRELRDELERVKAELKKSKACEAVCHCGDLLSQHHMGSGHSPVPMPEICPNAEENHQLKRQVEGKVILDTATYAQLCADKLERDQLLAKFDQMKGKP